MRQDAVATGMTRRVGRQAFQGRHLPLVLLTGCGLLLVAFGAALDVGHHAGVPGLAAETVGAAGHLVTLAGMVLTTTAVALAAALRHR